MTAAAQPQQPEAYFRQPDYTAMRLSPSGRYLGIIMAGEKAPARLAVMDLDDGMKLTPVAGFADADVVFFQWLNDQRLVFGGRDRHSASVSQERPGGLWAANRDGSDFRQLIGSGDWREFAPLPDHKRILPPQWRLHSLPGDGSADILVQEWVPDVVGTLDTTNVRRMNTLTGALRPVLGESQALNAPAHVVQWLFDSQARPAYVMTLNADRRQLMQRDAGSGQWRELASFDHFASAAIEPQAVDAQGRLYVAAPGPKGQSALYVWDAKSQRPEAEALLALDGFDWMGELVWSADRRDILGAQLLAERPTAVWADPLHAAIQSAVDKSLPDTVNEISCTACDKRVLIASMSDRQPVFYSLLDRVNGKLQGLAQSREWIDPARMAPRQFARFKARDGRQIPVYITQPITQPLTQPTTPSSGSSATAKPAVVLVHGGPWLRGGDGLWNGEVQFLAAHGYVVIEPEFRGSTGFGFEHFRAGWKEWGLKMQDDLDDALRWAATERGVDAKRSCIMGASYGGYAALMGLVREDSPWRCAVEWVGVSDIQMLREQDRLGSDSPWQRYGMPRLIGDSKADAAQIRATSPLQQAARIRRPLLMAYGSDDLTVPPAHGKRLRDALATREVEYVLYDGEGHGWRQLKTHVDFWSRVERFLDRHIGLAAQ